MPGNIAMRNFNTALGYHRNPEAAAVTWRPRQGDPEGLYWCFTGDIGAMDAEGRITLVDRSKDVVKTGGKACHRSRSRQLIPGIPISAIVPRSASRMSVGVRRSCWLPFRRLTPRTIPELAALLFSWGRGEMSAFKVPKKIAFVDELPRSHFGKVLKRELRDRDFHRVFDAPSGKSSA